MYLSLLFLLKIVYAITANIFQFRKNMIHTLKSPYEYDKA